MKVCKDLCPVDGANRCCYSCPNGERCKEFCSYEPETCGSMKDAPDDLQVFQNQYMTVFQRIADFERQIQRINDEETALREQLYKAMTTYGFTDLENDILKIKVVAPTTQTKVDTAAIKKKYPAIAAECSKTSNVKGYVRITVKGLKDNA